MPTGIEQNRKYRAVGNGPATTSKALAWGGSFATCASRLLKTRNPSTANSVAGRARPNVRKRISSSRTLSGGETARSTMKAIVTPVPLGGDKAWLHCHRDTARWLQSHER